MENIRPIRNEEDYDWALAEIAVYFDNEPDQGTPEADRFDVLASLIGAYEDRHWPIPDPDPIDAIKHALELRGMNQSGLGRLVGGRGRASEVMRRKRRLSLGMIQKIHEELDIPADILIQPYHLIDDGEPDDKNEAA